MHEETGQTDTPRPASAAVLRPFSPGDVATVLALLARAWDRDVVSDSWFADYVLLDPRFDPHGLLLAEIGGEACGIVYAVAAVHAGPGVPESSGWIPLLVVDPAHRNRGIGRTLLTAALAFLTRRGSRTATVGAYPPAYVIPGIDLDAGPTAASLLLSAGFAAVEHPVGMHRDLTGGLDADVPAHALELGYRLAPATVGDLPELRRFASTVGADWGDVLRESMMRHRDPTRFHVAFSPDERIVGFTAFGSYGGDLSRFGPFGVDPGHRGHSLGSGLLAVTLAAMRDRGVSTAWFLWTDLEGPAGRLYLRAGFTPFRHFAIYRAMLR